LARSRGAKGNTKESWECMGKISITNTTSGKTKEQPVDGNIASNKGG
jgi:hypothetical protein